MFQGSYVEQPSSGKKIHGFPTRREPSFSLGWDQSHQLNSYQKRKGLDHQVTGKITTNVKSSAMSEPYYDEALERQKLRQIYQKLSYQNPDIPPEQLERYLQGYSQQRRQAPQSQQSQQSQQQQIQRRAPIKQKDSMKDIIYNNVGTQSSQQQRAASRRNNSNLVLGNGYNHFQDNNNYNR